tara:strand:+ start:12 stop:1061 length:1050 start_codon:yes stop_codon:yes gene_type:complete
MSTLNSYEEVALAEKLIELHPWSDMVRFSKTGGEACSIAIRIARAFSQKSKIVFCGYHGWHDWYLSTNIQDNSNLNNQLLSGLSTSGVPKELANTSIPVQYGSKTDLDKVFSIQANDIAAVIMEPVRNKVDLDYLRFVKEITKINNVPLIFDEITSGFRTRIGGVHMEYGIEPDIAIFGKALGNGFPISAIIGKKNIMNKAQDTFISSTYWTERVGYVAALRTLEKFKDKQVQLKLIKNGALVNSARKEASEITGVKIKISGIEPLTKFSFDYSNADEIMTLYIQEMLKKGYLSGPSYYASFAHDDELINKFKLNIIEVFKIIAKGVQSSNIIGLLDGPVKHMSFQRLN